MGNSNGTLIEQLKKISGQWSVIGRTPHSTSILQDPSGRQAQQDLISLDGTLTLNQQLEIYLFRKIQQLGIVKIYNVDVLSQSHNYCVCAQGQALKVVCEHIPWRLSNVPDLTENEGFYVLEESLKVFRQLYVRYGLFEVTQDLIGFTQQGTVRVWCNPNYFLNTPLGNYGQSSKQAQAWMIQTIIDIIQLKLQTRHFPIPFNIAYNKLLQLDFNIAVNSLREYIANNQIPVPDRISFKVGIKTNVQTSSTMMAVPGGTKIMEIVTETIQYGGRPGSVRELRSPSMVGQESRQTMQQQQYSQEMEVIEEDYILETPTQQQIIQPTQPMQPQPPFIQTITVCTAPISSIIRKPQPSSPNKFSFGKLDIPTTVSLTNQNMHLYSDMKPYDSPKILPDVGAIGGWEPRPQSNYFARPISRDVVRDYANSHPIQNYNARNNNGITFNYQNDAYRKFNF